MSERFEYKIVQAETKGMGLMAGTKDFRVNDMELLNRLGRDGWDCYHVGSKEYPPLYYMKRKT